MKRLTVIVLLIFMSTSYLCEVPVPIVQKSNKIHALKLKVYYKSIGNRVNEKVIEKTLTAIDKYKGKYFPDNQFTKQDFIALAMIESDFHQFEVGSSGEVGIFQIMKANIPRGISNPFELNTNTRLAMKVLRSKFVQHKDYKRTIIAYNGLVYHRGKLSETYWDAFQKRKEILVKYDIN